MPSRRLSRLVPLSVAGPALALAACGGPGHIEKDKLARQVQVELGKSVGQKAPRATCPHDLEAKVGATTRCHMDFPGGKRLAITVRVTSVKGDKAHYSIVAHKKLTKTP